MNGGFIPVLLNKDDSKRYVEMLVKEIQLSRKSKKAQDKFIFIGDATFKVSSIIGWYFSDPMQSPSEKVIKILEKTIDGGDGDSWKKE